MDENETTWSYSLPDKGKAFPEHLADVVWRWCASQLGRHEPKPRSKESLAKIIYEAFGASLQVEEGRPVQRTPCACSGYSNSDVWTNTSLSFSRVWKPWPTSGGT